MSELIRRTKSVSHSAPRSIIVSEVTTLWRYTNTFIIIIVIIINITSFQ